MIKYITSDVFEQVPSKEDEIIVIPHVVNNVNAFGAGFVVSLGNCYPEVKKAYHRSFWNNDPVANLGQTQFVGVDEGKTIVANMFAQDNIRSRIVDGKKVPPLDYESLAECMKSVEKFISSISGKVRIVAPLFGAGLSGGNWTIIEEMIKSIWENIDVTICIIYQQSQKFSHLLK